MKTLKRISALLLALLLAASFSITAFADTYNIGEGSVEVNATTGQQTVTHGSNAPKTDSSPVITGSSSSNTVTINADSGATANVTLNNANISSSNNAAVSTSGGGNVNIELNGSNTVSSGENHAGVEKGNGGSLTITDSSGSEGSLNANGGLGGAGIGGGDRSGVSDITISGGEVNANGGRGGAGIGGGCYGNGSDITISGGTVSATGGYYGAGIGGGLSANGTDITISGGEVYASGLYEAGAGIGGGQSSSAENVTVSGSAQVSVSGGWKCEDTGNGAAIGNGGRRPFEDGVEIDPDTVTKDLTVAGSVSYYEPGTSVSSMKNGTATPTDVIYGTKPVPEPPEPAPAPKPASSSSSPFSYKLVFDLDGGVLDGETELEMKCSAGQWINLPEAPEKEGFTFAGWQTEVRGKPVVYEPGARYKVSVGKTFVALWEEN